MQYVEQQLAEFKAEFAKRRKRQLLATIPILIMFVVAMLLRSGQDISFLGIPSSVLLGAFFVLVLGTVAFSLWNWRCPACNRYLGKGISPSFCSKCGIPLQ